MSKLFNMLISKLSQYVPEVTRAKEFLRNIVDSSGDAIIASDEKGIITFYSKGAVRIFGFQPEEIIGKPAVNFFSDPEKSRDLMKHLFASSEGKVFNYECSYLARDGTFVLCDTSAALVRDQEGHFAGVVSVHRDMREIKELIRKLSESEDRYRTLAEEATMGIAIVQDNRYVYVNPAFCRMLGYTPEELTQKDFTQVVSPEYRETVLNGYSKTLRAKPTLTRCESLLRHKDGRELYMEINGGRINYDKKEAVQYFFQDITKYKETERALKDSE
ncbi:MAG: PAS domain S-box protein, partial [Thermodesulfobacteriota bacterium]